MIGARVHRPLKRRGGRAVQAETWGTADLASYGAVTTARATVS